MLFETDEYENYNSNRSFGICVGVILFFMIGAIVFIIYTDKMWREKKIKIAERKCEEYIKFACKTTSSNMSRIILGDIVPLGMFPHQAFVELKNVVPPNKVRKCGGSLISEYFVLSAAHCVHGLKIYTGRVKLGSVTRLEDDTGEWFTIKKAYLHYAFKFTTMENDMALLELNRKVKFKSHLRPICLNTHFNTEYDNVTVSGWGRTENDFESVHLRMVELNIYNQPILEQKCRKLKTHSDVNVICAGHPYRSNSAHQGDSGGPLQVPLKSGCPNTYELIGVTSAVENRDIKLDETLLSFYSKVEFYVPWIASHVWPDELDAY